MCIQQYIDYVDHTAIAFMSVSGDSFCKSAYSGFLLNLKHCFKFYFAQDIGGFFVTMGIFFITVLNTIIFYGLTKIDQPDLLNGEVRANPAPYVLFVFILSFILSVIMLGLFDDAVRAILMCYSIDCELNGGVPKYGPPNFQRMLKEIIAAHPDDGDNAWGASINPDVPVAQT